jgi:hypothetical protein
VSNIDKKKKRRKRRIAPPFAFAALFSNLLTQLTTHKRGSKHFRPDQIHMPQSLFNNSAK